MASTLLIGPTLCGSIGTSSISNSSDLSFIPLEISGEIILYNLQWSLVHIGFNFCFGGGSIWYPIHSWELDLISRPYWSSIIKRARRSAAKQSDSDPLQCLCIEFTTQPHLLLCAAHKIQASINILLLFPLGPNRYGIHSLLHLNVGWGSLLLDFHRLQHRNTSDFHGSG